MLLFAADAMEVCDSGNEDEEPAEQPFVAKEKTQSAADVAAVPTLKTAEERAAREEREREAKVSKHCNLHYQKCQLCGGLFHLCLIVFHKKYLSVLLSRVYLSPPPQPLEDLP